MSLGYASRLSHRSNLGGQLGAPEYHETSDDFQEKITELIKLFTTHKKIVVFTGAGISTSCGLPDFRGPNGIWTLQQKGTDLPKLKTSFAFAKPSLTHQALKCLVDCDKVCYIVSQNVDGIHLRSGIPREKLAELHGNTFSERCSLCSKEYYRHFEMTTVGFRLTGRRCDACNGKLRDHVLDWDDALPEDELELSEKLSSSADLVVCLGTSLQIFPACDIPLETVKSGGKLVIVNLQKTPKDNKAHLVVHEKVDKVMSCIMKGLFLKIPDFVRTDCFLVLYRQGVPSKYQEQSIMIIEIVNPQGFKCPLPVIKSIRCKIPDHNSSIKVLRKWPFHYKQKLRTGKTAIYIELVFVDEVELNTAEVIYQFDVLNRNTYFSTLRNLPTLPCPLNKSNFKGRLPILQYKEFSFQTQRATYS